jgi:hypothetical protein
LRVTIDPESLKNIYRAHQVVTLVKSVVANPATRGNLRVAWLSFQPFESNEITWAEDYYMFATSEPLTIGGTIAISSATGAPVQPGLIYQFADGSFTPEQAAGSTFNVANQTKAGPGQSPYSFGLAHKAAANGVTSLAPINAVTVLYNEQASFTPTETIAIFLSPYTDSGTVISAVPGSTLTITLDSRSPVANVVFIQATNTFYLP